MRRVVAVALVVVGLAAVGARQVNGAKSVAGAPVGAAAGVRGVALGLFASDPAWDYGPMVDEIRARGATDVLVVVNAVQSNRFASDIELRAGRSPNIATIERTLGQVRAAGMRAALMPVVRLEARASYEWRGVIAPADGLDAWFESYRALVLPLAEMASAHGVERFVVGSELGSLEAYEARWRSLIEEVRARFDGTVTYSANWDRVSEVPFWDALDEVGLTAYFPLGSDVSPDGLADAWRTPRDEMEALSARTGKPVLVTEVGYASRRDAAKRPWDDATAAELDLEAQRLLYRGFCDAFVDTPNVSGFYVWNWFGFGGPRDTGFTPRGKPAAAELSKCFAREWPARSTSGNRS
jgi:hypothetical protein